MYLEEVLAKSRKVSQFQTTMSELSLLDRVGNYSFSTRDITILKKNNVLAVGMCIGTPEKHEKKLTRLSSGRETSLD